MIRGSMLREKITNHKVPKFQSGVWVLGFGIYAGGGYGSI
jgi:hypothetical protein